MHDLALKRVITWCTILLYGSLELMSPLALQANPFAAGSSEVSVILPASLQIPSRLGRVETLRSGQGPTVVHIQTAHANLQAQQNIREILGHLHEKYGFSNIFLEGASTQLDADLFRFFSDRPDLNTAIAENLTKRGLLKGPELFLLDESAVKGEGIEHWPTYLLNRDAFLDVTRSREESSDFLKAMQLQIERLSSPYLGSELKAFLNRLEVYEEGRLGLAGWLSELMERGSDVLGLDLSDPALQFDWPMLVRYQRLLTLAEKLNDGLLKQERTKFLEAASRMMSADGRANRLVERMRILLETEIGQNALPDPETGLFFESFARALPENFPYEHWPQVSILAGHILLRSELKGEILIEEAGRLTRRISDSLARGTEEAKLLKLLESHRLLKRLFRLELTPVDWESVQNADEAEEGTSLLPSRLAKDFLALNADSRVRDTNFEGMKRIDKLFEKAKQFYRFAEKRDFQMLERFMSAVEERGLEKAVVVTGGFHTGPFREVLGARGWHYALVTPEIHLDDLEGDRERYQRSIAGSSENLFSSATLESNALFVPSEFIPNPLWTAGEVTSSVIETLSGRKRLDLLTEWSRSRYAVMNGLSMRFPVRTSDGRTAVGVHAARGTLLDRDLRVTVPLKLSRRVRVLEEEILAPDFAKASVRSELRRPSVDRTSFEDAVFRRVEEFMDDDSFLYDRSSPPVPGFAVLPVRSKTFTFGSRGSDPDRFLAQFVSTLILGKENVRVSFEFLEKVPAGRKPQWVLRIEDPEPAVESAEEEPFLLRYWFSRTRKGHFEQAKLRPRHFLGQFVKHGVFTDPAVVPLPEAASYEDTARGRNGTVEFGNFYDDDGVYHRIASVPRTLKKGDPITISTFFERQMPAGFEPQWVLQVDSPELEEPLFYVLTNSGVHVREVRLDARGYMTSFRINGERKNPGKSPYPRGPFDMTVTRSDGQIAFGHASSMMENDFVIHPRRSQRGDIFTINPFFEDGKHGEWFFSVEGGSLNGPIYYDFDGYLVDLERAPEDRRVRLGRGRPTQPDFEETPQSSSEMDSENRVPDVLRSLFDLPGGASGDDSRVYFSKGDAFEQLAGLYLSIAAARGVGQGRLNLDPVHHIRADFFFGQLLSLIEVKWRNTPATVKDSIVRYLTAMDNGMNVRFTPGADHINLPLTGTTLEVITSEKLPEVEAFVDSLPGDRVSYESLHERIIRDDVLTAAERSLMLAMQRSMARLSDASRRPAEERISIFKSWELFFYNLQMTDLSPDEKLELLRDASELILLPEQLTNDYLESWGLDLRIVPHNGYYYHDGEGDLKYRAYTGIFDQGYRHRLIAYFNEAHPDSPAEEYNSTVESWAIENIEWIRRKMLEIEEHKLVRRKEILAERIAGVQSDLDAMLSREKRLNELWRSSIRVERISERIGGIAEVNWKAANDLNERWLNLAQVLDVTNDRIEEIRSRLSPVAPALTRVVPAMVAVRSELRAPLLTRLLNEDISQDIEAQQMLLSLIPPAVLRDLGFPDNKRTVWDFKREQDVLSIRDDEILIQYENDGSSLRLHLYISKTPNPLVSIPLTLQGDTLSVGIGIMPRFQGREKYAEQYHPTFAYWLHEHLVPFAGRFGIEHIRMAPANHPPGTLEKLGFVKVEDRKYFLRVGDHYDPSGIQTEAIAPMTSAVEAHEYPNGGLKGLKTENARALILDLGGEWSLSSRTHPLRTSRAFSDREKEVFETREGLTTVEDFDIHYPHYTNVRHSLYDRSAGIFHVNAVVQREGEEDVLVRFDGSSTNDMNKLKELMAPIQSMTSRASAYQISFGNLGDLSGYLLLRPSVDGWDFFGAVDETWSGKSFRALVEFKGGTRQPGWIRLEGDPETNQIERVFFSPAESGREILLSPEATRFAMTPYAIGWGQTPAMQLLEEQYDSTSDLRHVFAFPYHDGENLFYDQVTPTDRLAAAFRGDALDLEIRNVEGRVLDYESVRGDLDKYGYQRVDAPEKVLEEGDYYVAASNRVRLKFLPAVYPLNALVVSEDGSRSAFVVVQGRSGNLGIRYREAMDWVRARLPWAFALFVLDNGMDPSWTEVRSGKPAEKLVEGRDRVNAVLLVEGKRSELRVNVDPPATSEELESKLASAFNGIFTATYRKIPGEAWNNYELFRQYAAFASESDQIRIQRDIIEPLDLIGLSGLAGVDSNLLTRMRRALQDIRLRGTEAVEELLTARFRLENYRLSGQEIVVFSHGDRVARIRVSRLNAEGYEPSASIAAWAPGLNRMSGEDFAEAVNALRPEETHLPPAEGERSEYLVWSRGEGERVIIGDSRIENRRITVEVERITNNDVVLRVTAGAQWSLHFEEEGRPISIVEKAEAERTQQTPPPSQTEAFDALENRFLSGPLLRREVVRQENERSSEQPTVVVSFDGTIAFRSSAAETFQPVPGAFEFLERLRDQGIRLVLWTDEYRDMIRDFARDYPEIVNLFERIITGDQTSFDTFEDIEPLYDGVDADHVFDFFVAYGEQARDLRLFGYDLLLSARDYTEQSIVAPSGDFPQATIAGLDSWEDLHAGDWRDLFIQVTEGIDRSELRAGWTTRDTARRGDAAHLILNLLEKSGPDALIMIYRRRTGLVAEMRGASEDTGSDLTRLNNLLEYIESSHTSYAGRTLIVTSSEARLVERSALEGRAPDGTVLPLEERLPSWYIGGRILRMITILENAYSSPTHHSVDQALLEYFDQPRDALSERKTFERSIQFDLPAMTVMVDISERLGVAPLGMSHDDFIFKQFMEDAFGRNWAMVLGDTPMMLVVFLDKAPAGIVAVRGPLSPGLIRLPLIYAHEPESALSQEEWQEALRSIAVELNRAEGAAEWGDIDPELPVLLRDYLERPIELISRDYDFHPLLYRVGVANSETQDFRLDYLPRLTIRDESTRGNEPVATVQWYATHERDFFSREASRQEGNSQLHQVMIGDRLFVEQMAEGMAEERLLQTQPFFMPENQYSNVRGPLFEVVNDFTHEMFRILPVEPEELAYYPRWPLWRVRARFTHDLVSLELHRPGEGTIDYRIATDGNQVFRRGQGDSWAALGDNDEARNAVSAARLSLILAENVDRADHIDEVHEEGRFRDAVRQWLSNRSELRVEFRGSERGQLLPYKPSSLTLGASVSGIRDKLQELSPVIEGLGKGGATKPIKLRIEKDLAAVREQLAQYHQDNRFDSGSPEVDSILDDFHFELQVLESKFRHLSSGSSELHISKPFDQGVNGVVWEDLEASIDALISRAARILPPGNTHVIGVYRERYLADVPGDASRGLGEMMMKRILRMERWEKGFPPAHVTFRLKVRSGVVDVEKHTPLMRSELRANLTPWRAEAMRLHFLDPESLHELKDLLTLRGEASRTVQEAQETFEEAHPRYQILDGKLAEDLRGARTVLSQRERAISVWAETHQAGDELLLRFDERAGQLLAYIKILNEHFPPHRSELRLSPERRDLRVEELLVLRQFRDYLMSRITVKALGERRALRILEDLLGKPVYAASFGVPRPEVSSVLPAEGGSHVRMLPPFTAQVPEVTGAVLLDSVWLDKFLERPRSLYVLLSALHAFQAEAGRDEAPLTLLGDDSLYDSIRRSLQSRALNVHELREVSDVLLPGLRNLIRFVKPGLTAEETSHGVNAFIRENDYGVATLVSDISFLSDLLGEAHFILRPGEVSDQDLEAVALLPVTLLRIASLLRDIDPDLQAELLQQKLAEMLPGVSPEARGFAIRLADYVNHLLSEQHIETYA